MLALLPENAKDVVQLGGPGRPWSLRYGSQQAVLRRNDLGRFRAFGQSAQTACASITWLHEALLGIARIEFVVPEPLPDLEGESVLATQDAVWELLAHLPGTQMGWSDEEMRSAGRLLGEFHSASQRLAEKPQRPGSHPLVECRPNRPEAGAIRAAFERELEEINHLEMPRGFIHCDATQSNVVIDERGAFHLVDFAIGYKEAFLADVGSALWRNARSEPDAVTYDPARAAEFVRGYATMQPVPPESARAIVVYMKGRGLQLQMRLELRAGTDETVIRRLLAIEAQQAALEAAIALALARPGTR